MGVIVEEEEEKKKFILVFGGVFYEVGMWVNVGWVFVFGDEFKV